jgi:hypothetical protein
MQIEKSSRHSHIIGKFGEYLLCNWLSRSKFEVVIVDHTGIDLIAYNRKTKQRLGFTVKSRTRRSGTETTEVNIFSYRKRSNDCQKLEDACRYFGCKPWIAIYVETQDYADLYVTSLENYKSKYGRKGQALDTWKMSSKHILLYEQDEEVRHIKVDFHLGHWAW